MPFCHIKEPLLNRKRVHMAEQKHIFYIRNKR